MRPIEIPAITIENFLAGLKKASEDYRKGGDRATLQGGCGQLDWFVRLTEFLLTEAGMSEREKTDLLRPTAALHAALTAPGVLQSPRLAGTVQRGADRTLGTVKQAYAAVGLKLRLCNFAESESAAARAIGRAFGFSGSKVIGWRDTAKRRGPKYPLLHDKFCEALQLLEDEYPGDPQRQYEAWVRCIAAEWGIKI